MGRAKVKMELIRNEKLKNNTFKRRKEWLIKKMQEFTTLCDVKACTIIYGQGGAAEPEIWPQNADDVRKMIDIYKVKGKNKMIFHDCKIDEDNNLETKYPTSPEFLDGMTEPRLREFAASLDNKLESIKSRIALLRKHREGEGEGELSDISPMDIPQSSHLNFYSELDSAINPIIPVHCSAGMEQLLMNGDGHCAQFGRPPATTSYQPRVLYETGVVDPQAMCQSLKPWTCAWDPQNPELLHMAYGEGE